MPVNDKLLITDILGYLPYSLELKANDTVAPGVMVSILSGMPGLLLYEDKDTVHYYELSAVKPLLLPLTVGMVVNKQNHTLSNWVPEYLVKLLVDDEEIYQHIEHQFVLAMQMFHIDYAKLIERGLAIDKTPYIK